MDKNINIVCYIHDLIDCLVGVQDNMQSTINWLIYALEDEQQLLLMFEGVLKTSWLSKCHFVDN